MPLRQSDLQWGYDRSDDFLICLAISFSPSQKVSPMFVYNVPIPKKALDDIVVFCYNFCGKNLTQSFKGRHFHLFPWPSEGQAVMRRWCK